MPASVDISKDPRRIQEMFGRVAPAYDRLNHLLSVSLDRLWRRRAARSLDLPAGAPVLDVCCGTGDQAIALARRGLRVTAADFCLPMLALARPKLERLGRRHPEPLAADALRLPFASGAFAAATVSFGLRNVADLEAALQEMARVLAPGGELRVLEFAMPRLRPVRAFYTFYFRRVLPRIGRWLSRHDSAYSYLPSSVIEFPQRDEFVAAMVRSGFDAARWRDLSGGTVCLYSGRKR